MKTIGIKLADGSFYPVLEDNTPAEKQLELTTAHNNQTKVMVDLYRSATCSMDDAEYVDSLQIENLVARPNGETDIKFSVSLDEDNQLQAKIVDPETGNESNTTITLVSRTLEERLITDDYAINDSDDKDKAGAGALAAGGLLAAAAAAVALHKDKKEDEESGEEFDTIEETEIPVDETAVDEAVENTEEDALADMDFDLPEDTAAETTETSDLPDMDFDLPEDTATETSTPETEEESPVIEDDSPVVEEESTVVEPVETTSDETVSDDFSSDETITSDISSDETISDDFTDDLFTEDPVAETETTSETTTEETSDDFTVEDSELPDMDFDLPDDNTEASVSEVPEMPDDFFKTEDDMKEPTFDSPSPAAGLNFDGLYDEETERGTSAETEADEVKKKTKVPVIICIICAIICIIATLLILFIIPSKYNLITKKHAKEAANTVAIEQPAPEPEPQPEAEPAVPQAKEDEIVIIEKAEEVVPQQPPVAEKPKNITYKIKWGDTLWDIADTYYKNPWRYKYIARYNGIKNPDYIISGTKIIIPAE